MQTYFITFGDNSPLRKRYVAIRADSEEDARDAMGNTFGQKWSMIYGLSAFEGQPTKWGLSLLFVVIRNAYNRWEALRLDQLETDELKQWAKDVQALA